MRVSFFNQFKIYAMLFILGLGIFFSQDPLFVSAENNVDNVVKIGYYENEIFEEGASEDAVKTGYAYEYYRKISEYTGWQYEYVYGSYSEMYQMLVDGEIDLLAGLAYKEDRSELFSYPDLAMGSEAYNIVKKSTDSSVTMDPKTLTGHSIGVIDGAMVDALNYYIDEHNLKMKTVVYNDFSDMLAEFDDGKVDLLAVEGNGTLDRKGYEVLLSFGVTNYYICVNKDRSDLLQELNEAQESLWNDEPYYLSGLSSKYYSSTVSAKALSRSEREWIETHDEVNVGYLNDYLPYCDTTSSGKPTGVIKDLIPKIFTTVGVEDININYQGYDNYDDMIAAIDNGEIDLAFPVGGGLYFSELNGINQSKPFVSSSTDLVYKYVVIYPNEATFAINQNNKMQYYYVITHYPDANLVYYDSIEECLQAVVDGEVDCTTLNGLRGSDILKNCKYEKLAVRQLANSDDRCIGVQIGNEGLLKIMNRGIQIIGSNYAEDMAFNYTSGLYQMTSLDWIRNNIRLIILAIIVIVVATIIMLVRKLNESKVRIDWFKESTKKLNTFVDNVASTKDKIIDEKIDLGLLELGKLNLNEDCIEIDSFINDLGNSVGESIEEKNILASINLTGVKHNCVICDEQRMMKILNKILSFAVNNMPSDSQFTLKVVDENCSNPSLSNVSFIFSDDSGKTDDDIETIIRDTYIQKVVKEMKGTICSRPRKNMGKECVVTVQCRINYKN